MLAALNVLDDREARSAAFNMAIDEALLEEALYPVLRFYRWLRPSVSFGYFGRHADVASEFAGCDLVRRWTGGGIVPHGDDLTYSIIIPRADSWFLRSSLEIYATVHETICRALRKSGVEAQLANDAAPRISEACFANAVRSDVLSGGEKIAGAAHRRSRAGLLHQGSIQRNDLPDRFRDDFARLLCPRFERMTLSPKLIERAAGIADRKYATNEWLTRW